MVPGGTWVVISCTNILATFLSFFSFNDQPIMCVIVCDFITS